MRGIPQTSYGETKKTKTFSLTQTAFDELKKWSQELGISMSELLERVARQRTAINDLLGYREKCQNSHPAHHQQVGHPGQKSMRNIPQTPYRELKKVKSFSLTPTAIHELNEWSKELGISASELLERVARQLTVINHLLA